MGLCSCQRADTNPKGNNASLHSSCQREENDFQRAANLRPIYDQDRPHAAQGVLWLHLLHHVASPQLLCTGHDRGSVRLLGWVTGVPWSTGAARTGWVSADIWDTELLAQQEWDARDHQAAAHGAGREAAVVMAGRRPRRWREA